MSLRVMEPLRIGEQIEIQLLIIPGNHFLTVRGEVLYQADQEGHIHMGIRFINLDAKSQHCIREFVATEQ